MTIPHARLEVEDHITKCNKRYDNGSDLVGSRPVVGCAAFQQETPCDGSRVDSMLKWIWNIAGAVERKKEGAVLQLHMRLLSTHSNPARGFDTLMGSS